MIMKKHILAGLQESFDQWKALLAGLSEAQILAPGVTPNGSIKDVIAHLWAWQQRSLARLAAALHNREPEFPTWLAGLDPDAEGATDRLNAWLYETNRDRSWQNVSQDWSAGFNRLLALAGQISERDLLDGNRYPWLNGYPLALILLASYDHHQEHYEKLQDILNGGNEDNFKHPLI